METAAFIQTRFQIKSLGMSFPGEFPVYTVIALADDVLVGHADVMHDPEKKVPFIDRVFVAEKYRKMGIGSELMNDLFEFVKAEGFTAVSLQVNKKNMDVMPFYERLGFKLAYDYGSEILMTRYFE